MQETTSTPLDRIPDLRAVRAGVIEDLVVPAGSQIRTCVRCGRSTMFVPDDPARGWYACTRCGRYA
jgi:hypothetical protein